MNAEWPIFVIAFILPYFDFVSLVFDLVGSPFSELDGVGVKIGTFFCSCLVPERGGEDHFGIASALVLIDNLCHFCEKTRIQGDWVKTQVAEFLVGDIQFVFGSFLARVGDEFGFDTGHFSNHGGDVADSSGFGDLVQNFDTFALLWRVVDSEFDASGRIGDVDEGSGLSSGSVNGQWDTHGTLHEETIQDGSVISVVIESVHQTFVKDGLGGVGSPNNTLMEIGNAKLVVLLVKLPEDRIHAFGRVVKGSGVGRVQNIGFSSSRKSDINVTLGNFTSRSSVSVNTHGSQVDNVGVDISVNDGAAQVIGSSNIVVDRVSLGLGILLGVRGRTLFGKVDNRIRFFFLDQLDEKVVLFGDINVVE